MKSFNIAAASLLLLCLALTSSCSSCSDEMGIGCTSDDDCRVGRMCIEEACAPARDTGAPIDQEDTGPGDPNDEEDRPRADVSPQPDPPSESMVEEYCNTEAECISRCVTGSGEANCDSPQRQEECRDDFDRWYDSRASQSTACAQTIDAWIECISTASCGEVGEFFRAHPDGVSDSTPCSSEYFKMECVDFEPPTEYGF